LTESVVYPREILRRALELKAAALILAHNHPSGDPSPSPADLKVTRQILLAAKLLQVRLLDHLVIAKAGYFSFAEKGVLSELEKQVQGVL